MAYIVKRPINLNGKRRLIGEIVQDSEIKNGSVIHLGWVEKLKPQSTDGEEVQPEEAQPEEVQPEEAQPEEVPATQPARKNRKKAKPEDGGEA